MTALRIATARALIAVAYQVLRLSDYLLAPWDDEDDRLDMTERLPHTVYVPCDEDDAHGAFVIADPDGSLLDGWPEVR